MTPLRRVTGATVVITVAVVVAVAVVAAAGRMVRAGAFADHDDAVMDPDDVDVGAVQGAELEI